MKFLIEKSILTPEQEQQVEDMNNYKKRQFATNFIRNHSNYSNLKGGEPIFIDSLLDDGFDDTQNDFIYFLNNIKINLPYEVVKLIKTLIDQDKLDPKNNYLYIDNLYENDIKESQLRVKAIAVASDADLQKGFNKSLTPDMLLNNTGKLLSAQEIEQLLNNITISKSNKESLTPEQDLAYTWLVGDKYPKKVAMEYVQQLYKTGMSSEDLMRAILQKLGR